MQMQPVPQPCLQQPCMQLPGQNSALLVEKHIPYVFLKETFCFRLVGETSQCKAN